MNTDFITLIIMMSIVSMAAAILVNSLCARFIGVNGFKAKAISTVITSAVVVGWDFLVLTQQGTLRTILAAIPVLVLGGLMIYYKMKSENVPEPHELAARKRSVKSQRAAERRKRREEAKQAARHPYKPENKENKDEDKENQEK